MLGSQALETSIGLALMFFVFATAASAIAEIYASLSRKRSKDLKSALKTMFETGELPGGLNAVTDDNVEEFVRRSTGRAKSVTCRLKRSLTQQRTWSPRGRTSAHFGRGWMLSRGKLGGGSTR